jgi:membrane protein YqaA with SNARE-associated domain
VFGLPPFMFTTVLAGLAGMSTPLFVATGAIGRFARFTVLAASPAVMASWLH